MQEKGFPITSAETMGSSIKDKTPLSSSFDAARKRALISSTEGTSPLTLIVKSVKEPFGTGTRIPQPPITKFGNILVNALAAPVVVGTMDCAAPLARRKSKCGGVMQSLIRCVTMNRCNICALNLTEIIDNFNHWCR